MNHTELLNLISKCKCVISDSGGIQEEASFYKKKVLVCRKATERPAKNQIMVQEPKFLPSMYRVAIANCEIDEYCPFGNGDSSKKIHFSISSMGIE
jgi:UDP-N-acetylglucosamine 2-epimerase (non-hydrolysing)